VTRGGTFAYDGQPDIPELVLQAVAVAREQGFELSCRPEQGRLLQLLATGRRGGTLGETGTGCGVGVAWLVSGADAATEIFSVERDPRRATAAAELFASWPNVTIINDDWSAILRHAPFDLLVLDGGGSGKHPADAPVDPEVTLKPFGALVIDDFTPIAGWPPQHGGVPDSARLHWLMHRDLLSTEIVLCPEMSTIVALRRH
jgi:predicted O-methyltransferase YrrM